MSRREMLSLLEEKVRAEGGEILGSRWLELFPEPQERDRVKAVLKGGLFKCIRETGYEGLKREDKDRRAYLQVTGRRSAPPETPRSKGAPSSSTSAVPPGPSSGQFSFVLCRTESCETALPVADHDVADHETDAVASFDASHFMSPFHERARDLPRLVEAETDQFLKAMPDRVASRIRDEGGVDKLGVYEVVLDLHSPPVVHTTGRQLEVDGNVTPEDIDKVCRAVSFDHEERAMMRDTLHRISRVPGRDGATLGITARIGRPVLGCATPGLDIVADIVRFGKSVLLLGAPGTGKTTILREFARLLSMNEMNQRVMIVDTSQEIAGDGESVHASVGRARRYPVEDRKKQYECMVRAVQNHTPSILVIDEIGSKEEAKAAATIRQRGVQLVATVHGDCLRTLVHNPELSSLVGGAHSVILSASEAAERGAKSKTVLNRKQAPVFDTLIELSGRNDWVIHSDLKSSVDSVLAERPYEVQRRVWEPSSLDDSDAGAAAAAGGAGGPQRAPALRYEYTTVETHAEKDGRFIV